MRLSLALSSVTVYRRHQYHNLTLYIDRSSRHVPRSRTRGLELTLSLSKSYYWQILSRGHAKSPTRHSSPHAETPSAIISAHFHTHPTAHILLSYVTRAACMQLALFSLTSMPSYSSTTYNITRPFNLPGSGSDSHLETIANADIRKCITRSVAPSRAQRKRAYRLPPRSHAPNKIRGACMSNTPICNGKAHCPSKASEHPACHIFSLQSHAGKGAPRTSRRDHRQIKFVSTLSVAPLL